MRILSILLPKSLLKVYAFFDIPTAFLKQFDNHNYSDKFKLLAHKMNMRFNDKT